MALASTLPVVANWPKYRALGFRTLRPALPEVRDDVIVCQFLRLHALHTLCRFAQRQDTTPVESIAGPTSSHREGVSFFATRRLKPPRRSHPVTLAGTRIDAPGSQPRAQARRSSCSKARRAIGGTAWQRPRRVHDPANCQRRSVDRLTNVTTVYDESGRASGQAA